MDWERFGIYVFSAFYGYACLTAPYKGRKWVNRLTVFIILLLLMWLPACDDTRTITETEYVDRDVIVTEPYYTRTVYDENMGEFTPEQQAELTSKGYLNMRLFYSSEPRPGVGGRIWVQAKTPSFSTTDIQGVCYGYDLFVSVGDSGKIAYSTDGDVWTQAKTPSFGATNVLSMAYGNSIFIACGFSGKIAYSSDGDTWTLASTPSFGATNIYGSTYGNGKFVAVGLDNKIAYSSDGDTWTQARTPSFGDDAYYDHVMSVACGGNFVAVGMAGKIAYSPDGDVWTQVATSTFGSASIYGVAYGKYRFVAVGGSGKIAFSLH